MTKKFNPQYSNLLLLFKWKIAYSKGKEFVVSIKTFKIPGKQMFSVQIANTFPSKSGIQALMSPDRVGQSRVCILQDQDILTKSNYWLKKGILCNLLPVYKRQSSWFEKNNFTYSHYSCDNLLQR